MTSGNFHNALYSSITVDREARQRRELVQIDELAESINRIGLIHPIVVTRDHVLVAGERRYTAIGTLGWTHIPVQYTDELSTAELRTIELEENIKRVDIPWQDQVAAIEEYHRLRAEESDEGWSTEATAKALGISKSEVVTKLGVAKAINEGNEKVLKADKYSVARGIVAREAERKQASTIAAVAESVAGPKASPIITADFAEWQRSYIGPKFNFIHCDFPYGVNMQRSGQGSGDAHGTYEDTPEVYWHCVDTLEAAMANVVAESAHLMFWLSMKYYTGTVERLTAAGWRVNPTPMVWMKSDNVGVIADAQRGPRNINEYCLIASRGDRKVVGPVANGFHGPTERDVHMSVKPETMLRHFFRMFVDQHSAVLDPTCGSGGAVRAALALGASRAIGLEVNPEFAELARSKML